MDLEPGAMDVTTDVDGGILPKPLETDVTAVTTCLTPSIRAAFSDPFGPDAKQID